jgi:hypothetical protein
MLSKEQVYTYNYILNQLGKRILPQFFYEKNPSMMSKWQHQICRQSHIIAAHYLNKWLNKDGELNYNIQFCESIFKDTITEQNYDHSWVWVESISEEMDNYLCDIARVSAHIGFTRSLRNMPGDYLQDVEFVERRLDKIDYLRMMEEKEYYTRITGKEIINEIDKRLKDANLWIG